MTSKTLLTTLGIIAIIIVIFFLVRTTNTENDAMTDEQISEMNELETNTPEENMEVEEGTNPDDTTPSANNPQNPNFPTTGFEPVQ